ncbi:neural-cadherin-like isoform X4 [Amphibalanus amphitrite]|uniref:neural-cadherin-like isoform X4 n=1 Tax=Amphibalanus amphitrite TaxID=1232801 RepID=UPI001C8FDA7F|nr:neural-cadherin-like isoform X4 [Amphibalanus amphitrite]
MAASRGRAMAPPLPLLLLSVVLGGAALWPPAAASAVLEEPPQPVRRLNAPADAPVGHIVTTLGSGAVLLPSEYSERFAMVTGGRLMTVLPLQDLAGARVPLQAERGGELVPLEVRVRPPGGPLHCDHELYEAHVFENEPAGADVEGAGAIVAGGGAAPEARYSLIAGDPDDLFRLEPRRGAATGVRLVTAAPLDREQRARHEITIELAAADERAACHVLVHVIDRNDNVPVLARELFTFAAPLSTPHMAEVGRLEAADADGDRISFQLAAPSEVFVVEPLTGRILLAGAPRAKAYELLVSASDVRDGRRYHTSAPARVHVEFGLTPDEGEKADVSAADDEHRIAKRRVRRAVRPTKRLEFREKDGNQVGKEMFILTKEVESETFKIRDENPWVTVEPNGQVKVKKKWDYEELGPEKSIDFWVTVKNTRSRSSGPDQDNQRIIIRVEDDNDENPYFINRPLPMQAVVKLNAPPNTPIFTLQARDPDTDHNIHYFLVKDRTGGRFQVDERSGVVRTRGSEPFQLDMEYFLYVRAEDQGGRDAMGRFQSTEEERLSIVGGKRQPQFYMPGYEAKIFENHQKDTDVISVKAKSFADREIRYTLKAEGQGAGTFNIGPTSGVVKLAKELDFEDVRQPHMYSLVVTATEDSGGFSTSVELTIKVMDVNDNSPKFELPDYQTHNVEEDIPIGSELIRVKGTDADSGTNADLTYSVSDDHFRVDDKGVIYNNRVLDADNNNGLYQFLVTATDRGEPAKTGTATVRVYTKNKNDEEPRFTQQVYTPNVDENAGPNALVTTVVASDKDGDRVKYGFANGGNTYGQFMIEQNTGVIRLRNGAIELDRDKYEVNVTATDDGSCCDGGGRTIHTSTAVVVVFITDVNDNKPLFKDCDKYHPTVEESASNGRFVLEVKATDADKGINGQVKYSIVQQPNQKGTKFTVDEDTGKIYTNKVFDREGDDGKFVSVTVKATDKGSPSLEGVCSFTVEILDVNDNPPLFDRQKYVENVKQDTHVGFNILRVSASDEDADNNGVIVYNLSAPQNPSDLDYFSIQPDSGWITLQKPLDLPQYRLRVTATDLGRPERLSSEADIVLDVINRDSNPPIWSQSVYGPVHVPENVAVGQRVYTMRASSGIEGNPTVFYSLIRGSTPQTNKHDTFYLQERSKNGETWADIQVNQPLDYEDIKEYNLTIRVENNGAQQLASEATIYIVLDDVNDEIPLFTEREQETVLEGEPPGTKVTQVNAIDKDGTFPNKQVYYSIIDSPRNEGKDFFEINEHTGEIFTKKTFDREYKQAYALEVAARDGAPSSRTHSDGQPNTVTKFIRIGISDKNDNPPYFDKRLYEAEVDENEDIQHIVLTVVAKDIDESSRIRYELTQGNVGGAFGVKNSTGAIYVAGPLDFETRSRYELRLVASDNLNENYTDVVIHVRDVNDNPPLFDKPIYQAQITEEDDRGLPKQILQVAAKDKDVERPADIVYFLTGQGIDVDNPSNSMFTVNRTTGEISVTKPLDRDMPNGRPRWRFTVFAQDEGGNGLVGYAEVQVNLKDINDNAPVFPKGVYRGNVTENGTKEMMVMTMTAEDYDDPEEGNNAKLAYSIEKNVVDETHGKPIFAIEPSTGVIRTNVCCLDREKTPEYSIQVVAMDGGGLKGTGTALIHVRDINDMPPRFSKAVWNTTVDETDGDDLPDKAILTVTVLDEDETNKFHYKVLEDTGYGADKFTMVRNSDDTGSLKIVQPLDYEDMNDRNGFSFTIQVNDKGEDQGDSSHVARARVHVKLRDINDNRPIFDRPNIEVHVKEDAPVGQHLETFHAKDPDQGGRSKVSYAIDRESDRKRQFTISGQGKVSIQRGLDREEVPRHHIKILAIDDGVPPKTATATLTVIVDDVNDNAPTFLEDYRPVLMENAAPREVAEVMAADADDRSSGNGPPFTFKMDPRADDTIRSGFRVEHDSTGNNGDGMAIVRSLKSFDREDRKEYHVPIVIRDAGKPSLSGTSTLTVIIGDLNDNRMYPGSKEIFVYNYKGMNPEVAIGRVHVTDKDDWDLPDKTFYWEGAEHPSFILDEHTGTITMRRRTLEGRYHLRFHVFDRKHTQRDIDANVTVVVQNLPEEAVLNSGSVRIAGISDEDFIRVWDEREKAVKKSKLEKFREVVAGLVGTPVGNVDVFSVQLKQERPPVIDVRYSAHGSPYYKAVMLDGMLLTNRIKVEEEVGINITMISIDECLYENVNCEGSCTNNLVISTIPYLVNANKTSLVGVRTEVVPECTCMARNFTREESCSTNVCLNGGKCVQQREGGIKCMCRAGYDGPRCQQTSRSFRGDGWAWLPPLSLCEETHLAVEFVTRRKDGLILYNGPIKPPEADQPVVSDFIALELEEGNPRLLLDFGSGTLELRVQTAAGLDDGEWHRLDVFWDRERVRLLVDLCAAAQVVENDDGLEPVFQDGTCAARGTIPPFNEYLNVNAPLQLGGVAHSTFAQPAYGWDHKPNGKPFDGCIRNLVVNSEMYDLSNPGLNRHSYPGCPQVETVCSGADLASRCGEHGRCVGSMTRPDCECNPGWSGPACSIPTIPATFKPESYVKYALSFPPNDFHTDVQLRFRTREDHGELFRVSDQHNREWCILEINDARLRFRYNLNILHTEEHELTLSAVTVNDGQWHVVRVTRHGSAAILRMDGGEGRRYNETIQFTGHQKLLVDKQEGVWAGGKAEYTGIKTFEVYSDYKNGCLDDIRLEGRQLPLPPAMNGTQWGQATLHRNLKMDCPSNDPCANVICPTPFSCIDMWKKYDCACGEFSVVTADGKACVDRNECLLDNPCLNGGLCVNRDPEYECRCRSGFTGRRCGGVAEPQVLRLSMGALAAILVCLLIILILVLVFVVYNRQKERQYPKQDPYDDVRENIINYDDEGGGEDDMTAFDITPLQIPIGPMVGNGKPMAKMPHHYGGQAGPHPDVGSFIDEHKERADTDPSAPPYDDLRNYAYEGGGSTAGSLSSLASGTDENEQDFDYLNNWGPRFSKLADMYGRGESEEDEEP